MSEGLVSGEGFGVDASVIRADANRARGVRRTEVIDWNKGEGPSRAVREYLEALEESNPVSEDPSERPDLPAADMTAQVLRAKQSGAEAMLVWSALPAPTIIARNAQAVGYDKPRPRWHVAMRPGKRRKERDRDERHRPTPRTSKLRATRDPRVCPCERLGDSAINPLSLGAFPRADGSLTRRHFEVIGHVDCPSV